MLHTVHNILSGIFHCNVAKKYSYNESKSAYIEIVPGGIFQWLGIQYLEQYHGSHFTCLTSSSTARSKNIHPILRFIRTETVQ